MKITPMNYNQNQIKAQDSKTNFKGKLEYANVFRTAESIYENPDFEINLCNIFNSLTDLFKNSIYNIAKRTVDKSEIVTITRTNGTRVGELTYKDQLPSSLTYNDFEIDQQISMTTGCFKGIEPDLNAELD